MHSARKDRKANEGIESLHRFPGNLLSLICHLWCEAVLAAAAYDGSRGMIELLVLPLSDACAFIWYDLLVCAVCLVC